MTNFKGHKGPWLISPSTKNWIVSQPERSDICKISDHNGYDDIRGKDLANAHLIASAPELLNALQSLVEELDGQFLSTSTNLYIENANKAINKALGI